MDQSSMESGNSTEVVLPSVVTRALDPETGALIYVSDTAQREAVNQLMTLMQQHCSDLEKWQAELQPLLTMMDSIGCGPEEESELSYREGATFEALQAAAFAGTVAMIDLCQCEDADALRAESLLGAFTSLFRAKVLTGKRTRSQGMRELKVRSASSDAN